MSSFGAFNQGQSQNQGQGQNSGIVQQLLYSSVFVIVLYISFIFVEILYKYLHRMTMNRTELLPYTYNMEDKMISIVQNPNLPRSKPISLSDNERTGIEFTYSFYLNVHPAAFRQEYGLLHIFHKGYSQQIPLLAPGVYMRSDTNTLRVYMNTYKTWNNYIEVENFPVSKWVHVCIVCKESSLEIYINGNLSKKAPFDGYTPYQNFQDICCFNQRTISFTKMQLASADETGFNTFGTTKGMLSRLNYFSYALCYTEIQRLMNEGPSDRLDSSAMKDIPPYLADTWWSTSSQRSF